jgi:hypothetical protein
MAVVLLTKNRQVRKVGEGNCFKIFAKSEVSDIQKNEESFAIVFAAIDLLGGGAGWALITDTNQRWIIGILTL